MHRGGFPPGPPFRDEMMLSSNLRPEGDFVPLSQDPVDPKRQRALRSVFSKSLVKEYEHITVYFACHMHVFINAHHFNSGAHMRIIIISQNTTCTWHHLCI